MSVRRENVSFMVEVATVLRHVNGNPACQCHLTFAHEQGLACQVNSNQRSGTSSLYGEAGPFQVEPVRSIGGQVVFFIGKLDCERPQRLHKSRMGKDT